MSDRPPTPREALREIKKLTDKEHTPNFTVRELMSVKHLADAALEAPDPVEELVRLLKRINEWGLAGPGEPTNKGRVEMHLLQTHLENAIARYGGKK